MEVLGVERKTTSFPCYSFNMVKVQTQSPSRSMQHILEDTDTEEGMPITAETKKTVRQQQSEADGRLRSSIPC